MLVRFLLVSLACLGSSLVRAESPTTKIQLAGHRNHACNGNCAHLHTHHRHRLRHSERTVFVDEYAYIDDATVETWFDLDQELQNQTRYQPEVSVRSLAGAGSAHSSSGRFDKIEYGALQFEVFVPKLQETLEVVWILDGQQMHPENLKQQSGWEFQIDGAKKRQFVTWACPPLGRHSLQVQLKLPGNRVETSESANFEIVPPQRPKAIALGYGSLAPQPIKEGQIVEVFEDEIKVRFSMPQSNGAAFGGMLMQVEGFPEVRGTQSMTDPCCYSFDLSRAFTVGRHGLRFRRVVGDSCSMTSEHSSTVWVQYEPRFQSHISLRNIRAQLRNQLANQLAQKSTTDTLPHAASDITHFITNPSLKLAELKKQKELEEYRRKKAQQATVAAQEKKSRALAAQKANELALKHARDLQILQQHHQHLVNITRVQNENQARQLALWEAQFHTIRDMLHKLQASDQLPALQTMSAIGSPPIALKKAAADTPTAAPKLPAGDGEKNAAGVVGAETADKKQEDEKVENSNSGSEGSGSEGSGSEGSGSEGGNTPDPIAPLGLNEGTSRNKFAFVATQLPQDGQPLQNAKQSDPTSNDKEQPIVVGDLFNEAEKQGQATLPPGAQNQPTVITDLFPGSKPDQPTVIPDLFEKSVKEGKDQPIVIPDLFDATGKSKQLPPVEPLGTSNSGLFLEHLTALEQSFRKLENDLRSAEDRFRVDEVVSEVIFDAPVYFTRKGHARTGQEDARSGLVLLEGMELKSYANGKWELRIPYQTPQIPVKLHLQLQYQDKSGRWKSLTLPPICFSEGDVCANGTCTSGDCSSSIQNGDCYGMGPGSKGNCSPVKTIQGYSPLLKREAGYFQNIRRRGTATFGYGYAGLNSRASF